jgi:uncharacterized membrane protein
VRQDQTEPGDPAVERTITLTDAVVAIAMTLLVLPLVDLAREADTARLATFLSSHGSDIFGFVVSFLVIYQFWLAHERAFVWVHHMNQTIRILNMLWLLGIAFLPFPTALVGRHATTATAPFYIATMFVLSVLSSVISQLAVRQVDAADSTDDERRGVWFMWGATAVFGVCAAVSLRNPDLGLWGLLLILVVRLARVAGSRPAGRRWPLDRARGGVES